MAEQDGRKGLVIRPKEKDHAPPILNFGFLIDGSDLDNVRFTTTPALPPWTSAAWVGVAHRCLTRLHLGT